MSDISAQVTKNFNENILYLQENHPEVFSKLVALDNAIENSHYHEKYELVYEDGGFDVLEKKTNSYLYAKKSTQHASLVAKSINFNLDENLFQGFHQHTLSQEQLKKYENAKPFEHHMSGFAPILHYVNNTKTTLKTLDKFIFFGTGLGLHIGAVDTKIRAKVYLIVEDDLELFRLSLFCTNYKELASRSKLLFSVFEDPQTFNKTANFFLQTRYYYNHYIKYFHILSHCEKKIQQFQIALSSQSHLLFFYNTLLTQYLQPLHYLFDKYKFLKTTLSFSHKEFEKKPFLLLGAGPSLEKNMVWLKENHQYFTIVALSAILFILEDEGITPDIITHLDAFESAKIHFKRLDSLDFIKESILIYSSRIPQDVSSLFDKNNLYFLENNTSYKEGSLKLSAPCIGSLSYQLLLRLQAKYIYLLGLDLAVDSQTLSTHSGSHAYGQVLKEQKTQEEKISFKESLFEVPGNLSEKVLSTPNFKISIDSVNDATKMFKTQNQHLFNIGEGAFFADITPIQTTQIDVKNTTQDIKPFLHSICTQNTLIGFTKRETEALQDKIQHAKKIQNYLLQHKELHHKNTNSYLKSLEELSEIICQPKDMASYEINRVLDTYLRYILEYIFDFFNTHQTQKDSILPLDTLLTKHLLEIVEFYIYNMTNKEKAPT